MRILLDGYFDRNLGDDLMLTLAAEGLKEHELYVPSKEIKINNTAYSSAKNGFDVYLKVTGDGFRLHNTRGVFYRLRDITREKNYAPRRAVIGCSISEPINGISAAVIKKHLAAFDCITVRDDYSLSYIKEKLPEKTADCYPDMVFSLPDSAIPDTVCEGCLGIAVHNSVCCETLAAAAAKYIEETGRKTLLLCFDLGRENDALAAEKVAAAIKYKDMLEIIRYETVYGMLSHMKRCSCIVGARFHSIILASRMGIPFVPIVYSEKTSRMLSGIGYNGKAYRAADADASEIAAAALDVKPFSLSSGITELSKKHIEKFRQYIERQQD